MHCRLRSALAFLGIVAGSHALAASVFDGAWKADLDENHYVAQIDAPAVALVGDPRWDHVAVKMPDPRTLEETMSKDGEVRMRSRWSIDADGVTMHARFENTKGEVF